jgi:hypothetical protein
MILRVALAVALFPLTVMAQTQIVRQIPLSRSGPPPTTPFISANAAVGPEIDSALVGDGDDFGPDAAGPGIAINRTVRRGPGSGMRHHGSGRAKSNPELSLSIDGLNHFQQRFVAAGGNQFSIEPPDQGLCVGNGFVLETVNDVLRIFDTSGNPLTAPTDLNSFYGYAPAINRTAGTFGPSITDPSCTFDVPTQRWFHVVLTLDRASPLGQGLSGTNHLDVAVSATVDPTGVWNIYRLPVQDDGTQGTPDHGCVQRSGKTLIHGPCLGDYPHIGADANGFYITTNEFSLAGPGFHGAQIYAFSKAQLAAGAPNVTVVQFDTADPSLSVQLDGNPGFTVWPALSTGNQSEDNRGSNEGDNNDGTEYFVSSEAVFQDTGVDNRLRLWSLTRTGSLNRFPALNLNVSVLSTIPYSVPLRSVQKPGDVPLAQCLSDALLPITQTLSGCWRLVTGGNGPFANTEKLVDSNDSRIQGVAFANGKLWAVLGTGLSIEGDTAPRAGIAFFVINPHSGKIHQQGYAGLPGNNLTYPAVAVTESGRGVVGFTMLGNDHYPTAAYAGIDAKIGMGEIHVAAEGVGPDDGFTGYNPQAAFGTRPRWGDYGAAASDGKFIWIANEYINQTCTYNAFISSNFRCGSTRTQLANWSTRISKIVP